MSQSPNETDTTSQSNGDNVWYAGEKERLANVARQDQEAAREEQAKLPETTTDKSQSKGFSTKAFQSIFKGSRKKSPIVLILVLLFGGGGIFTAILAPGVTLLSLADILERDLNSQLSAMDRTSSQLWRTKLKQTTDGSCGAVKIRCKFATVNKEKFDSAITRANAASPDKLEIKYDDSKGWGENRARIQSIKWVDESGTHHDISKADDFTRMMKENPNFRSKMYLVYSPKFSPFKSRAAVNFLAKSKTSYSKKLKGNNEKEVAASMDESVRGQASINVKKLTPLRDEKGNLTGEYGDPDTGQVYTEAEARGLQEQENRLNTVPSSGRLLGGLAKGVMITSYVDSLCTVYNTSRAVSLAAKTLRARELIRYSMVFINEAHAIRAEMATPATVEYASKLLQAQTPEGDITDEKQLASVASGESAGQIKNPEGGKYGMDSRFLAISQYQNYPKKLNAREQRFQLGSGTSNIIDDANLTVAKILGARDARQLSQRCKVVQNPVVRTGSLIIGIAAGVGSFGATTAISAAGSVAVAFALPYLTAQLAEMAAGTATKDIKGLDSVDAVAVGADAMYNGMAREQGLMTMKPEDMVNYQNGKREAMQAYDEIDQIAAAKNPFDITNQFSFLGSLARTSLPIATTIRSGGGGVLASLPQIATTATNSLLPLVGADDGHEWMVRKDRYTLCNDPDYAALGPNVAINPTCVMVFGLPKEAMDIDPMENLEWMLANDEIIPDSDSGDPKDNGRNWNYKKFVEQCVDQQPGATEDIEADPSNGGGCTDQNNYEKNWHYAKFKLSIGINEGIDQDQPGLEGGAQGGFDSGETSTVGLEGWAYPTVKSTTNVSSGFGMRGGSQHNGTDLAGPLGTPIFAARDGKVIKAGPAQGFGNWIIIQHEMDGKRVDTVYGHMATSGVLVKTGQEVKAGQMIGRIGNEGFSTGPHLHFEIWPDGYKNIDGGTGSPINPQPYLDKASGGSG